jgi:hypothetical protein
VLALASADVGLIGALQVSDSGSKKESRRSGGSGSIDEVFESGYPQAEWVREKTRKRAPAAAFTHTLSTAVERDVDAEKALQIGRFCRMAGVLRARGDAAMLAAS